MIVVVCREKNVLYNKMKKIEQVTFRVEKDVAYLGGFNAIMIWKEAVSLS